jgi:GR25 family glycosyltransferase involved in LPS biosynthesis
MNIYKIPLYYISFKKQPQLEKHFRTIGFENVNHHQAIDSRTYKPKKLLDNGIISIRSYDDLTGNRNSHSGLPTPGSIGCALSQYTLWNKCIEENMPFIIIAEDDVRISGISKQLEQQIIDTLSKPDSIFCGVKISQDDRLAGTQFYFISNSACKKLIQHMFPIDVQVDWYMSHLCNQKIINCNGTNFTYQTKHKSSVQGKICVKCILPDGLWFYILMAVIFLILLILSICFILKIT